MPNPSAEGFCTGKVRGSSSSSYAWTIAAIRASAEGIFAGQRDRRRRRACPRRDSRPRGITRPSGAGIDAAARVAMDREPAFVQQRVVMRAEQREVLEARVAAIGPVADVVRVDVARATAARERAAAIARPERALERRRHRALLAADVERRAALVLDDRDHAAVAARRFTVSIGRSERPAPSAEGRLVDVHDDLVVIGRGSTPSHALSPSALARRRAAEIRLRDRDERIRLLRTPAVRRDARGLDANSHADRSVARRDRVLDRAADDSPSLSGSSTMIRTTPRARSRNSVSERRSHDASRRCRRDSGSTLRICRQRSSTCARVASSAYASSRSSSCVAATRVSARTFEYDSRPSANAAEIAAAAQRLRGAHLLARRRQRQPAAPREPLGAAREAPLRQPEAIVELADEHEHSIRLGVHLPREPAISTSRSSIDRSVEVATWTGRCRALIGCSGVRVEVLILYTVVRCRSIYLLVFSAIYAFTFAARPDPEPLFHVSRRTRSVLGPQSLMVGRAEYDLTRTSWFAVRAFEGAREPSTGYAARVDRTRRRRRARR